ncbi:MAG: D-glycerate dehydrogenase [Candidatus Micrarchaeota archaeon]
MGRPKVFVTRPLPGNALHELRKHCDIEMQEEDRLAKREEIAEGIKGKDALLCLLTDKIDGDLMDQNPNLKIISNYAVGFDNIDIPAATHRKILVTNTPGVLTETTADLTMGLLLAAARRIVESDKFTREARYEGWGPSMLLGVDVYGKTLGVVGLGRIGRAVATRAYRGFGMNIIYNDPQEDFEFNKEFNAKFVGMDSLITDSDFISIHVPLTPKTKHMFKEKQFHMMKKNAVLVNTSRGAIIEQAALAKALKEKRIFAAALDVYEDEPRVPVELIPLSNVIMVPHIGSASLETRSKMADMAVQAILDFFSGKMPVNAINKEVMQKK